MDGGIPSFADGNQGLEYMARVERRQRPFLDSCRRRAEAVSIFEDDIAHPSLKFSRDTRCITSPGQRAMFRKSRLVGPRRYGLWLDKPRGLSVRTLFADGTKYPGFALGARGKACPSAPTTATHRIVGLRLFPNPAFDEAAAGKWVRRRFYETGLLRTKDLVRHIAWA